MITTKAINNNSSYDKRHLRQNDYYSEGESVAGIWHGEGAKRLGLSGEVNDADLESLRANRQPGTNEKLTPRDRNGRNASYDVCLSSPKSVSILSIVGGDERVLEAYHAAASKAIAELEKHAAVRERRGRNANTNHVRTTGNIIAAAFTHDASRELDPQLHTHVLVANATYDADRGRWFALQTQPMMEESVLITRRFREDLANQLSAIGYEASIIGGNLRIAGISASMEMQFSQRTQQRLKFEDRYRQTFGTEPSKKRIEQFIKEGKAEATKRFRNEYTEAFRKEPPPTEIRAFVVDWRDPKLKKIATADVRRLQRSRLAPSQLRDLEQVVQQARVGKSHPESEETQSPGNKAATDLTTEERPAKATPPKQHHHAHKRVGRHQDGQSHHVHARAEAIRRLRRGLAIQAAFRGSPQGLVTGALRGKARQNARSRYRRF